MKVKLILSCLITCNLAIIGAQQPTAGNREQTRVLILVKNSEGKFEQASLQTTAFIVAFHVHEQKLEELCKLRDSSLAKQVEPGLVKQLNERISFLEKQPK